MLHGHIRWIWFWWVYKVESHIAIYSMVSKSISTIKILKLWHFLNDTCTYQEVLTV